jgi:hypothetical protein
MDISISCELYSRLSAIPMLFSPEDQRKHLKSIYLERRNNQLYAITTNVKIAAIEYLGKNDGPDECTAIVVDPVLIAQCEKEISFNSNLSIVANSMLSYTAIKTTFGYQYPSNGMVQLPDPHEFTEWRKWFPDAIPTKSFGAMFWRTANIQALASASPTGGLRFPEFIDTTCPVVVCDKEATNWVGLFMGNTESHDEKVLPASIPDWV